MSLPKKNNSPLRVLYLMTDTYLGGTERTVAELVRSMRDYGVIPYVAVLRGGGELEKRLKESAVSYIDLSLRSIGDLHRLRDVIRLIDSEQIGIIHSFLFHANMLARLIKCVRHKVLIINSHRTMEKGATWHLALDRLTRRLSTYAVSNAEAVRIYYSEKTGYPRERSTVVYNALLPFEHPEETPRPPALDRPIKCSFMCVGSLWKAKGQGILCEAFKLLYERHKDIHLYFVGDGPLRAQLAHTVKRLKIDQAVSFLGKMPVHEGVYRMSDCVVIPSLWEGMPNVLLEALASQAYVIATDAGGIREIAQRVSAISVVSAGSHDALYHAMREFYDTKDSLKALCPSSAAYIRKRFTTAHMLADYRALYDRVLDETRV